MVSSRWKSLFRTVQGLATSWVAEPTQQHLEAIRRYELEVVSEFLPPSGQLLEIGSGAGWQAQALQEKGYVVRGIDIATSNYRDAMIWPVTQYDGHQIPFEDESFDIVFSSNVLEHIPHVVEFQKEIHRVLKPRGKVIHLIPSGTWRWWTNLTHLAKCWSWPNKHGELASNCLSEISYFRSRWWRRMFEETGWTVETATSNRLFYTGHSVMDSRLSIGSRHWLSQALGGSCNLFVLRDASRQPAESCPSR